MAESNCLKCSQLCCANPLPLKYLLRCLCALLLLSILVPVPVPVLVPVLLLPRAFAYSLGDHAADLLAMPLLYVCLGSAFDVLAFVALYAWALSNLPPQRHCL